MNTQTIEKGKSFKIIETIQYQKNAIVSKIILKKDTGNITLFAFDKNQALSEHKAPYDALVHIIEGKAEIIIDGKSNLLSEGEIILMPANISHAVNATEKFKMLLIMIKS